MLTGHCLCGDCRYEIVGEPVVVAHCHCDDCQRLSGAGHASGAMFAAEGVTLTGPVARYELTADSGATVTRIFCPRCGSPLFGMNTGMPGFMTVTLGTLDDSDHLAPQVVVFARNRRAWDVMDPAVQTFETQPGWTPKDGV
ncbi:hypothetical protein QO010_001066 [Caulobacter ginsengisoli]|uniref:CENP-V/GFA domain-containing protein n=1 Tax=Caulobacter ginsengisoli TaxID=400775 RepID=A0ABU0IQ72_9CAUL|nr:GFA family protein [Caulobacter ginsengisoli]MDQ0463318.1 hypothetical protein [Caulobacter ginsengisoli]